MFNPLPDPVDPTAVRRVLVTKLRHHGDVLLDLPRVHGPQARAPRRRDRRAGVPGNRADARRPSRHREHPHHRSRMEARRLDRASRAPSCAAAQGAARAPLRPARASHRASARRMARPRCSSRATPSRASANARTGLWRTSFTHLYRLPRATPRHTVECNLDALRRIGLQPADEDKRLVLCPDDKSAARVRNLLRATGAGVASLRPDAPGFALAVQMLAAGALGGAARPPRRGRAAHRASPGRPTRANARSSTPSSPPAPARRDRASSTWSARSACASSLRSPARRARSSASIRRRCTSPRRWVRRWWRCSVRAAKSNGGRGESSIVSSSSTRHPCRPCGIDGCGGGKISECLSTLPVERVHAAVTEILALRPRSIRRPCARRFLRTAIRGHER